MVSVSAQSVKPKASKSSRDLDRRAREVVRAHKKGTSLFDAARMAICRAINDTVVKETASGTFHVSCINDSVDEVFASRCNIHMERMSDHGWWIGMDAGGKRYSLNFGTTRAPIHLRIDEDAINGKEWTSIP